MDIVQQITQYCHSRQTSMLGYDCLFAKHLQYQWLEQYEVEIFAFMFRGRHIKKSLGSALDDVIDSSWRASALTETSIADSVTSESYLKATLITRTRKIHEITVFILLALQKYAYESLESF